MEDATKDQKEKEMSVELIDGKVQDQGVGEPAKKEEKPRHAIFDAICASTDDDVEPVRKYVDLKPSDGGVSSLEVEDDSGMTPLMHAVWKGKVKVAKFLLAEGADVNGGNHDHDYTALHFAALAGKVDLCKLLVDNGAKTDATNSVKRTPAAMAAFVGEQECRLFTSCSVRSDLA
jgi:ankyrin repeat protein